MEIPEQALTLDLPTLLVDARNHSVQATHPGLAAFGYQAVEGKATVGLRLECPADDPTRLQVNFRFLSAHYEPPANCHPETLRMIHRLNSELNARLLGDVPPGA